jgi:hypothetical protein
MKGREFIDQLSDSQLLEMKLLKKLLVALFVNKFPTFHGARSFFILNIDVFWDLVVGRLVNTACP